MKTLARLLAPALLIAAIAAPVAETAYAQTTPPVSAANGFSAERLARVQRVLQAYVDQGRLAGVVVQFCFNEAGRVQIGSVGVPIELFGSKYLVLGAAAIPLPCPMLATSRS